MFPVDQPWANEECGISGNEMHREMIMCMRDFLQFYGSWVLREHFWKEELAPWFG